MENNKEMFTYSNVVSGSELNEYDLTSAPIFIQEFLNPKIDCRVTYVQGKLFPVKYYKMERDCMVTGVCERRS